MGGEGSGRRPSEETIVNRMSNRPVAGGRAPELNLPNYSGVPNIKFPGVKIMDSNGTHAYTLKTTDNLTLNRDINFNFGGISATFDQAVSKTSSPTFASISLTTTVSAANVASTDFGCAGTFTFGEDAIIITGSAGDISFAGGIMAISAPVNLTGGIQVGGQNTFTGTFQTLAAETVTVDDGIIVSVV